MAGTPTRQAFYASRAWIEFRLRILTERAARPGGLRCEACGERILDATQAHVHHVVELTDDNVHDVMISMNPELVQVLHVGCHNKMRRRVDNTVKPRRAYIVYGPPLSGKTTYVREHMERGDLVVDFDMLFKGVSTLEWYDKPNELLPNVRAVHALLLDQIKTRYGKWGTAWVIGGYADHYRRNKLAEDLGAELVFLQVPKEECLKRLVKDPLRCQHETEWREYIDKWFTQYSE